MAPYKKMLMGVLVALALLMPSVTPASAKGTTADLPPLPEWPIVGPVLRLLGISAPEAESEVLPTPDPALPEYRITAFEDMEILEGIEPNERVRIIVAEQDLNAMILEVLRDADLVEDAALAVDFAPGLMTADLRAGSSMLNSLDIDIDIPAVLRGRNIVATATMGVEAAGCSINVSFEKLSVNRWRLGLRPLATRMVNDRIPDFWSSDICVEAVYLMEGEAAVEGYRR